MLRALLPVLASLAAIVAAAPAAGQSTEEPPSEVQPETVVLHPIQTTRHRLTFTPESIPADAVTAARVRLHRRGNAWTRGVPVTRVQDAAATGSPFQIHKMAKAGGRLKVKVGGPDPDEEPPPPPSGVPDQWDRAASFESALNDDVDFGWRADSPFRLSRTDEVSGADGSHAAKIVTNGGDSGCSCPRMTFQDGFSYRRGDEGWISGSWRIPDPSKLAWSRLMNLGHWESSGDPDNWVFALLVRESGMSVQARSYQSEEGVSVLMPARPIPRNRWFRIDIHFKLSPQDGEAETDVYLDGDLISSSTENNMWAPRPLTFYNAGLSYFWPGNGNTTVFFDAPRLTSGD